MTFCIECGQKLVDGAKFCSNCGKQVTQIQSDTTDVIDNVKVQTVKSKQSQNKQFSLFNNQIIFDGDLVSVIEVQKKFLEFAWDKRNKFVELYNSKINTLEDLFDIGLPQFISDIQEAVNLGVKTLMEYGVDYIDNGRLTDLASEDFDIENVWQPIFNEANIIDEEAERLATYRNVQRASRSRWQGGGFGIGGAIKGALTAGAMNIATGAFRGIGDSLTDSSDRAKIAKMQRDVISNRDTLSKLSNGIYDCCFSVFYSVYEILCNEEILVYEFEDMENQNARLNNYLELHRKRELGTNELVQFLCECIQLNPFGIKYYVELYRLGLPNRKDILSITMFVGLKGEYQYRINSIDKLAISQIDKRMPEDTIPELEQKIASLEEISKENTGISVNSYINKYKKKISELKEVNNTQRKIEQTLDLLRASKNEIDNALQNSNLYFVWNEVNKGNVYAEYVLERYYSNLCKKDIENYNVSALNQKLSEVEKFANAGNAFAIYIINYILYDMYSRDRQNTTLASESAKIIIDIAKNSNNISAMTRVGFWGSEGYNIVTHTKADGVKLLKKCAELYHPTAMAWLGSYYRTGKNGLVIDKSKAKYYLTIAADFGQPYAVKELEKLNNDDTSSSSCYITTAVCTSFGKPDDCYELQSFRCFRDNWLKYQEGGESLIKEYYETAPQIVEVIDAREDSATIYQYIWENYLTKCLSFIETKEFEKCKQLYIRMVEDMKLKYL